MAAGLGGGAGPVSVLGGVCGGVSRSRSAQHCGCHPPSALSARRPRALPAPRRGGVPAPLPEWKAKGGGAGPARLGVARAAGAGGTDGGGRRRAGAGSALLAAGPAVPARTGSAPALR